MVIRNMCPRPLSAPGCSWEYKQGEEIEEKDESYLIHLVLTEFLTEMYAKNIFHWEKAACSNIMVRAVDLLSILRFVVTLHCCHLSVLLFIKERYFLWLFQQILEWTFW